LGQVASRCMTGMLLFQHGDDEPGGVQHLNVALSMAHEMKSTQLCVICYCTLAFMFDTMGAEAAQLHEERQGSAWGAYTRNFENTGLDGPRLTTWGMNTDRTDPTAFLADELFQEPCQNAAWTRMPYSKFERLCHVFRTEADIMVALIKPLVQWPGPPEPALPIPETEGEAVLRKLRSLQAQSKSKLQRNQGIVGHQLGELLEAERDLGVWGITQPEMQKLNYSSENRDWTKQEPQLQKLSFPRGGVRSSGSPTFGVQRGQDGNEELVPLRARSPIRERERVE